MEDTLGELKILEEAGFNGVILENYGDAPFYPRVLDPLTISVFTVIAREAVRNTSLEVGLNLLRNSGREAYSIAVATGAHFIRVDNLVEILLTDSGIIAPEAPNIKTVRINYPGIKVYSDIACKHAVSLSLTLRVKQLSRVGESYRIEEAVRELVLDAVNRGGADGLIVTGRRTGEPPDPEFLRIVKKHSPAPVIIGSGFTPENARSLIKYADGVIVGSYLKADGKAGKPVSEKRTRFLVKTVRELSSNNI